MKKTQIIELLAQIRATLVSFLSIVMFVALGVGVFLGIRASARSLERSAETLFEENAFHDFEILYPYGISEDDIAAIRAIDGITQVVPNYRAYVRHTIGDEGTSFALHSITEGVDTCTVVEGTLPTRADEIALSSRYAQSNGIKVGDTISFDHDAVSADDADGMRYLAEGTFKVTALVTNPLYLTQVGGTLGVSADGGSIEAFAFLPESAFDPEAFMGMYPAAYVRADALRGSYTFSDTFRGRSDELKAAIEAVGEPRAKARYDAIYSEAKGQLDDAAAQIAEGEALIDSGKRQIEQGEDALVRGEAQIEAAIAQLENSEASYDQMNAQISPMIANMRASMGRVQASYDEAVAELDAKTAEFNKLSAEVNALDFAIVNLECVVEMNGPELEFIAEQLADEIITQEEYDEFYQNLFNASCEAVDQYQADISANSPTIVGLYPELSAIEKPAEGEDLKEWTDATEEHLHGFDKYVTGADAMLLAAKTSVDDLQARVDALAVELDNGWAQVYAAEASFNSALANARSRIDEGRAQVEEGQQQLDESREQLEEGKKTIDEKSAELEEGKAQYDAAKAQVDALVSMNWIVNDRYSSGGAIMLDNVLTLTNNLRVAMASLFVIVGLLVCYSAVSRIVHDQVTQIGAKKALGFRSGEITASYLSYTALAVLLGALLGQAVSVFLVQGILYGRLQANFDVPRVGPSLLPHDMLFITAVELALLLFVTWFACRSVLKRSSLELLAGEQKASARTRFYERWPFWQKLPLFTQTVINNCVNDPRRVFGTLIGVAGCTALVVTASMLKNNIARSIDTQYSQIFEFNATVRYDGNAEGTREGIEDMLDAEEMRYTPVLRSTMLIEGDEDFAYEFVYVPESEEGFADLFHMLVTPSNGIAPTQGVWLSRSHADHRDLKVGDVIELGTVTGENYAFTIAGFFEFYTPFNTMVMSPDYYRAVFGREPVANAMLVDTGGADVAELGKRLASVDGFNGAIDELAQSASINNLFSSVTTTVVFIYVALSAIMAIIVLLNLDVMFINEKKRELIVLMINGFSVRDAKRYIYRDAIVMTVLGILAGVGLGILVGAYTVGAVEWQSCSFIKLADLPSCLLGAGASALFATIMMVVALRRIPRFSLTDISKF